MGRFDWLNNVPVLLIERFYKKCKEKEIPFHVGIIEAINLWLDKD